MKQNQEITVRQSQNPVLTPGLLQSLSILQMPFLKLETYLSNQLLENCMLEQSEEKQTEIDFYETLSVDDSKEKPTEKADRYDYFEEDFAPEEIRLSSDSQSIKTAIISTPLPTLQEHLLSQLHFLNLSESETKITEYLIERIDEDGYLKCNLKKVSQLFQASLTVVENLLYLIQSFEPTGVGARNLEECLLLQLRFKIDTITNTDFSQKENIDIAMTIIEENLHDLAEAKLTKIASELNLPIKEIQKAVDLIKHLDPKPGRNYGNNRINSFITPDVTVRKIEDQFQIIINEPDNAKLSINPFYRQLCREENISDENVLKFIREKQQAAIHLIKSLEQRRLTLYKITEQIINFQHEFFDKGSLFLKPLTLRQIAAAVGIHESTVSRAITEKYLDTPRGLYPFKFFFTTGVCSGSNENISAERIKQTIQLLINREDSASPLSDQQLVTLLKDKGIAISRRTVTKYREDLGVPASPKRKRY